MLSFFRLLKVGASFLALGLTAAAPAASAASGQANAYAEQLDALRSKNTPDNPEIHRRVSAILDEARRVAALPVIVRDFSLAALEADQSGASLRHGKIDTRTWVVKEKDPAKAETFALAMSDESTCATIARELPLLAAAYRLTGEAVFLERIILQLRETIAWNPLQRHGWTLYSPENTMPPDGDGVWLATGIGLAGLYQTLQILPPDALPEDLRAQVRALAAREIGYIRDDWAAERPWYVRKQAHMSNQWVLPSSGLVAACLIDGPARHKAAYELGVANLSRTLNALGEEGAVSEGFGYAIQWTAPALYLAALGAADAGDTRLSSHPFLQKFPLWLAQSFQPGENVVNGFDYFSGSRGLYHVMAADITRIAALSRDPYIAWISRHQVRQVSPDLYGLLVLGVPPDAEKTPPLWGVYSRAHWAVWRGGWEQDASGVWIRGLHPLDFHSHWDTGHVNFIVRGSPLLIEAATPGYNEPLIRSHYQSVRGHNVLQIGNDLYPKKDGGSASITVNRMDELGGDVTVDAGTPYPQAESWTRRVVWDSDTLTVTDTVVLKKPESVLFRWHLGSENPLDIRRDSELAASAVLPPGELDFPGWTGRLAEGNTWTPPERDILRTPAASITVSADAPVHVYEEKNYDHTIKFRQWKHEHTTLLVRSKASVRRLQVTTTFDARPPAAPAAE